MLYIHGFVHKCYLVTYKVFTCIPLSTNKTLYICQIGYSVYHNPSNIFHCACSIYRIACVNKFVCNSCPHTIIQSRHSQLKSWKYNLSNKNKMKRHMITDEWLRSNHPRRSTRSYRFFENGDSFEAIWCNMCTLI